MNKYEIAVEIFGADFDDLENHEQIRVLLVLKDRQKRQSIANGR